MIVPVGKFETPAEQPNKAAGAAERGSHIDAEVKGILRFDDSKGLSAYVSVVQGTRKHETRVWF